VTQQFIATATFTDGSTEDISSQATWASDTVATATISTTGLAIGVAAGTTNITVAIDGVTRSRSPFDRYLAVTAITQDSDIISKSRLRL